METPTDPRDPSSSPAAVDPRPQWVILNCDGCSGDDDGDRVVAAGAKTVAESRTSTGRQFRVSMGLAPPPSCSYLYHALVGSAAPSACADKYDTEFSRLRAILGSSAPCADKEDTGFSRVVAAHGDSVLFLMATNDGAHYFVYSAGGGGGAFRSRPHPRLILLPGRHVPQLFESPYRGDDDSRALNLTDTGLLRRGDDEHLVAQLEVPFGEPRDMAELCVLRVGGGGGGGGWEFNKSVPIVQDQHGGGKVHVLRDWWEIVAVIPVGDGYLCWLNYLSGFLVCDMAAAVDKASPPKLRYVRLPADLVGEDDEEANEEYTSSNNDPPSMKCSRNMCAAGAGAVRLVSVDSRCCCGGPGSSTCKRSRFAFTVTTWTLKPTTTEEPVTWVQDGVLDCVELWALPEYGSLPRVPLEYPVVSSDDPDAVCFRVRNDYSGYLEDEDTKVWLLQVDTRTKRLRSIVPTTAIPRWKAEDSDHIRAKFHY